MRHILVLCCLAASPLLSDAFAPSFSAVRASRLGVGRQVGAGWSMGIFDSIPKPQRKKDKAWVAEPFPAPSITLFDNPGCARKNLEYTGPKAGTLDDERCVVIKMDGVRWGEQQAQVVKDNCIARFNILGDRILVADRIKQLNGEAKLAGLPPNKWPFPPGYLDNSRVIDQIKDAHGDDLPPQLQKKE